MASFNGRKGRRPHKALAGATRCVLGDHGHQARCERHRHRCLCADFRLADCVAETKQDLDDSGLIGPIVGHVGDGNFHVQPLVMMDDDDEVAPAKGFLSRLSKRAIAMDGTCTGEHGVGQGKIGYLEAELGTPALMMMRAIKQAIDPDNIMNPGKVFFPA